MSFLKRKKVLLILLVILLGALFLKSCFNKPAVTYMTAVAKKGDIEVSILATGILKPYRLVAVGARTTGRVTALSVRPGQTVSEGEILAQIDPINQQNNLKRANATLAMTKARFVQEEANLKLAHTKLVRTQKLMASRSISEEEFDKVQTQAQIQASIVKSLEAQIEQAEVDISIAQNDLSYTKITAPIQGTVLATLVQEGQTINAAQSAPTVVILGDLSRMRVYAQISEADIGRAKAGQKVYFTVLGNASKRYEATVENIEPAPELIRTDISFNGGSVSSLVGGAIYYNATFTIDNADRSLYTYMTTESHIILGEAKNVLTIPSGALRNINGDKAQVSVLHGRREELRDVSIGLNDRSSVNIKTGLKEGEVVILGASNMKDVALDEVPEF